MASTVRDGGVTGAGSGVTPSNTTTRVHPLHQHRLGDAGDAGDAHQGVVLLPVRNETAPLSSTMGARMHRTAPASPASPTAWLHALLYLVGSEPQGTGLRQCPSHGDSTPSLSVTAGQDGRALVHCFGGCPTEAVLHALGLTWRHLYDRPWLTPQRHLSVVRPRVTFPPVKMRTGSPAARGLRLVGTHVYGDGEWLLERYRHITTGAKQLCWFSLRNGVAIPGLLGVPIAALPLYWEVEVKMALAARERVVVCESESSVDALVGAGVYATTWAGGASTPNLHRLCNVLAGGDVVIVPDNDEPGRACGERLRTALRPVTRSLTMVMPASSEDARDLLVQCGPGAFTGFGDGAR